MDAKNKDQVDELEQYIFHLEREYYKQLDILMQVNYALVAEAQMNAAKHMSAVVRPSPMAAAVNNAVGAGQELVKTFKHYIVPEEEEDG